MKTGIVRKPATAPKPTPAPVADPNTGTEELQRIKDILLQALECVEGLLDLRAPAASPKKVVGAPAQKALPPAKPKPGEPGFSTLATNYTADDLVTKARPALLQIAAGMGLIVTGKSPSDIRTAILEAQGSDVPIAAGQTVECDVSGEQTSVIYGLKDSAGKSYRVGQAVYDAVTKHKVKLDDIISGAVELT